MIRFTGDALVGAAAVLLFLDPWWLALIVGAVGAGLSAGDRLHERRHDYPPPPHLTRNNGRK